MNKKVDNSEGTIEKAINVLVNNSFNSYSSKQKKK